MSQLMIDARGVTKSFGTTLALDHVDLQVQAGTVLGLLGPNGAGKTTLVRILTTLLKADSGVAKVAGYDVESDAASLRSMIGLAGQFAAVDEMLTGRENLELVGLLYHLEKPERKRRAEEVLQRLGLKPDFIPRIFDSRAFPGEFRKGLRGRRVSALVVSPEKGGEELRAALGSAGVSAERVAVYSTVPAKATRAGIRKFLSGGPYDFITFASPSAFLAFGKILGKDAPGLLAASRLAAIGRVTAAEMRRAGAEPDVVPSVQTMAGLAEALKKFCAGRRGGGEEKWDFRK